MDRPAQNTIDFVVSWSGSRYLRNLLVLALVIAFLPALSFLMAKVARQTVVDQRRAEQTLAAPQMRFLQASPQFHRPFKLALDRNFLNERSSFYSSPALSYLDKKGLSTEKLVEQYENLWRLLEQLQLNRDFAFEAYALRTFLTASSSEVKEAMGDKQDAVLAFDGIDRYKFLSEQGLAWYLQHYYLDPATALTQARQYGSARQLIYEALRRLQFRPIPLSRYLHVPEYDRVMLLAAIFAAPEALIGRDEILDLLLRIVGDGFPEAGRFELEANPFPFELLPLQKHFLGIYDIRSHNYDAAVKNFLASAQSEPQNYLRDLSAFMVVRARFWSMHDSLVKRKTVLSTAEANHFAAMLEDDSRTVRASNLRANIREYISLVKSDFISRAGLMRKPAHQTSTLHSSEVAVPLPSSDTTIVPALVPTTPLPPIPIHR